MTIVLWLFFNSLAAQTAATSRVENVFTLTATAPQSDLMRLHWEIPTGYYLYRSQLKVQNHTDGVTLGEWVLPPSEKYQDAFFGELEIYRKILTIDIPILENTKQRRTIDLTVSYQGCPPRQGTCYPLHRQKITVSLPEIITATPAEVPENISIVTPTENNWLDNLKPSSAALPKGLTLDNTSPALNTESSPSLNSLKQDDFLDPMIAFQFSAEAKNRELILLRWQIQPAYYLYRDKFKFTSKNNFALSAQLPAGIIKEDPLFGTVEVYTQSSLEIPLIVQGILSSVESIEIAVEYQGCAEAGLCYPPLIRHIILPLPPQQTVASTNILPLSVSDQIAQSLADDHLGYTLLIFFGFGLLLAFTPCIFPMIPILSSLIIGQGKQVTMQWAFLMSLVYVLAISITYTFAGILAGLAGENLQIIFQNQWVIIAFAGVFVLLAFSMFGFYDLQLPTRLQTQLIALSNRQKGGTLIGVAIMGFLSALIVGPCVAAPLAGALIYIGKTGDAVLGGMALFSMSIGMGIPLLLIGISAGSWLPKADSWMDSIKAIFGVLLLAVAIWLLERVLPAALILFLWAALLIISAVYMGALDSIKAGISAWYRLWKGVGLLLLVYGVLLMIGAASGSTNPLKPLEKFSLNASANVSNNVSNQASVLPFKQIKGLVALEQELAMAKAQQKPVLLDFYADWCIACKEMEHFTFSDAEVQKILRQFVLLQTDVTPNDELDKSLYKKFEIFGPPALIFYNLQGAEQRSFRVVGFMSARDFHQHVQQFLKSI